MEKVMRKIIEIDEALCNGCGECIKGCAENALKIVDGKARVISDRFCDGLGACLGVCPTGALKIVEKETEPFVGPYSAEPEQTQKTPCKAFTCPASVSGMTGHINWPLKIMLTNPEAGYLKQADLVVVADCSAVALPDFYNKIARGKVVLTGCPKFEGYESLKKRLSRIFVCSGIDKVGVVIMDVPCCGGLLMAAQDAVKEAKTDIGLDTVVVERDGRCSL